ncbi:MAG TPA: 3-hydroxybutyryl-CoA dehydrogenase [bacterium]|nr:3-hydroxybutyryl-CoA dehydrogenase [bacterium]HMW32216.1 3-hydroxybutyryl-CoA dehydrogenase [bacterium]HMW36729.1 3-hydroxybutyryl-CoA dehydrogenase [bacterium]HMY34693.1 3-hydroxybutyryl-CoA dehydrogenase [bacterium]HMZ03768.1 3-hydroxybutyryl-CoA dehydrogenase [bacterium]
MEVKDIKTVGVLGCGLMGAGIAQVAAASGFKTIVREVNQDVIDKGVGNIKKQLERNAAKGKITAEEKDKTIANLTGTTSLDDLKNCDFIIEAIIEDVKIKNETYAYLDKICPPHTIFASNTSSLTVTEMAAATNRPDRFCGMHFFNPVPVMKLVEIVKAVRTSEETFNRAFELGKAFGKTPIATKDNSGFVVNFLLVPYLLGAIRAVQNNIASIEDIDKGMMLGCGYPMGPLTLLDFVGIDTTYRIAEIMFKEYGEPMYSCPPLLRKMFLAGFYGRKNGKGFYDYSSGTPVVNKDVMNFVK